MRRVEKLNKKQIFSFSGSVIRYIVLISFSYMLIYPIAFMISTALKTTVDYYDPTVQWIPKAFTLENFKFAVNAIDYLGSIASTFINEIGAAIIEIVSCMIAAYGLSRFNIKGQKLLTVAMIITILIPYPMVLVPSYVNYRHFDVFGILNLLGNLFGTELRPSLLDSPLVFWLPSIFAVGLKGGMFIYIYSQFFKGLPKELEEAAWIDGAGPFRTFTSIIVPSSSSAIITVSLFSIVWHWNDYYLAQMYLSKDYPLGVQLVNIYSLTQSGVAGITDMNQGSVIMAAAFLVIAPLIVFYIFVQKSFIESVATSGIVG